MIQAAWDQGFYTVKQYNSGIFLCFVRIPEFASSFISHIDPETFRRERQRVFDEAGLLSRFFNGDDFKKINGFKVLKKQVEWMAGKVAVKILAKERGVSGEAETGISAEENGAPFLTVFPHIPISISHSGDVAVSAMGDPGLRLALDIEKIEQGRMQTLVNIAFSDREIALLQGKSDEDHYKAWTLKEAYLKYIKKGFAEGLKKVEILNDVIVHNGRPVTNIALHSEICFQDYVISLIHSC